MLDFDVLEQRTQNSTSVRLLRLRLLRRQLPNGEHLRSQTNYDPGTDWPRLNGIQSCASLRAAIRETCLILISSRIKLRKACAFVIGPAWLEFVIA